MGQRLRVMSANLLNGAADPAAFAGLVASLDVDVLAVQEVGHGQAEILLDLFDSGEVIPAPDFTGMGLLARHDLRVERIPLTWGFGQVGALRLGGADEHFPVVEITNLHIAAPHMWAPMPGPLLRRRQARELAPHLRHGSVDARGEFRGPDALAQKRCESTSNSRAIDVSSGEGAPPRPSEGATGREAREGTKGRMELPRLLVGDFNATPYWPWYWRMHSQFTDVAVAVADKTGDSPRPTWGVRPGTRRLLRIDHGFMRGLEAEAFEVVDVVGSDHSAIVMDLSFSGM